MWLRAEHELRDAVFDALAPARWPEHGCFTEIVPPGFWEDFAHAAPWYLQLGVRLAVWLLALLPLLLGPRRTLLTRLYPQERDEFMLSASRSDSFLIRQCVMTLKVVLSWAYFHQESVRSRFDYRLP